MRYSFSARYFPRSLCGAVVGVVLCACGSTGPSGKTFARSAPAGDVGFPSQTSEGAVYAEARFREDHRGDLGLDLIKQRRIMPVELMVQLAPGEAGSRTVTIKGEQMSPRLYLQDGTALDPVDPERVIDTVRKRDREQVREQVFRAGILSLRPTKGYLFFELPEPREFAAEGYEARRASGEALRLLRLDSSVLAFDVSDQDERFTMYVGVQR